jgi:hypothetical protein
MLGCVAQDTVYKGKIANICNPNRGNQDLALAPVKKNAYRKVQDFDNARESPFTEYWSKSFKQENLKPIRSFIKRHIKEGRKEEAIAMLNHFRYVAKKQPGNISGENFIKHFDSHRITSGCCP